MTHTPPVLQVRTDQTIMTPGEIAAWTRLLAGPAQPREGEVLCVLNKTFTTDTEMRTIPFVRIVQMKDGRPTVVQPSELSRADRRTAGLQAIETLARRVELGSMSYLRERYDGPAHMRREMKDALHCILPGAIITVKDLCEPELLCLFGTTHFIRDQHRFGDWRSLPKPSAYGHIALNPAMSAHDRLAQHTLLTSSWERFRAIWAALLPDRCDATLGEAPPLAAAA